MIKPMHNTIICHLIPSMWNTYLSGSGITDSEYKKAVPCSHGLVNNGNFKKACIRLDLNSVYNCCK